GRRAADRHGLRYSSDLSDSEWELIEDCSAIAILPPYSLGNASSSWRDKRCRVAGLAAGATAVARSCNARPWAEDSDCASRYLIFRDPRGIDEDVDTQTDRQTHSRVIKIDQYVQNISVVFFGRLIAPHGFAPHPLTYTRDHATK